MNISRSILLTALTTALLPACGDDSSDTTTTSASNSSASTATTTDATTDADASTGGASGGLSDSGTSGGTTEGTDTASPTTGGGVADCGFDPGLVFDRGGLVYQLQSTDGATCVWLERRDDSEPDTIYKAIPYTLLEFKAGHDGAVAHVDDLAKLTWESTHHNWNDVATAEAGAVRYRLEDWLPLDEGGDAFTAKWALYARDAATDAVLWGPVLLYPYPK